MSFGSAGQLSVPSEFLPALGQSDPLHDAVMGFKQCEEPVVGLWTAVSKNKPCELDSAVKDSICAALDNHLGAVFSAKLKEAASQLDGGASLALLWKLFTYSRPISISAHLAGHQSKRRATVVQRGSVVCVDWQGSQEYLLVHDIVDVVVPSAPQYGLEAQTVTLICPRWFYKLDAKHAVRETELVRTEAWSGKCDEALTPACITDVVLAVHACTSHCITASTCQHHKTRTHGDLQAEAHPNKRRRVNLADPRRLTSSSVEPCDVCLWRGQFDIRIHDPSNLRYEIIDHRLGYFAVGVPG